MNFITRSWLHLKAKKGRTLLMVFVTTAILTFVLAGLTIKNAADTAISNAKKETGATVTLQVSRDYMMQQMEASRSSSDSSSSHEPPQMTMTPISLDDANAVAKLSGVKSYLFSSTTTATASSGITAISSSSSSSSDSNSSNNNDPKGMGQNGDFTITGVNATTNVSDFSNGTNTITNGSGITSSTADNEVVISSDLAKANNLSVGDSFTVTTTANNETITTTLKIVGIYSSSATVTSSQIQNKASNPQNNIYTTLTTANAMKGSSNTVDSAVYTLKDPSKKNDFVAQAKNVIDTDKFEATSNDQVYQQMLSPLNSISSIAQNIVILVAVAGAVILSLIIVLNIRERRYEIGVLMSLGESRLKIIGQFFTELLVVTIVAVGLSSLAGNVVGNALGQQLISQQTTSQTTSNDPGKGQELPTNQQNTSSSSSSNSGTTTSSSQTSSANNQQPPQNGGGMPGRMSMSNSQAINQLKIKQTPQNIAFLGGIALMITFISTVLGSIGILRMKPKDILSSR